MRCTQVVPSIADEASGPSYSVPALSSALAELGSEVHLHVLIPVLSSPKNVQVHAHPRWPWPARLGISPAMRRSLCQAARSSDILHNHSLWMMPNIYPAWAVRGTTCRLVFSPRGTLAAKALQRSPFRKKVMWLLGQGRAARAAHCFHATAESELAQIRAAGLRAPTAVIPNGIDIPPPAIDPPDSGRRRLLFLGRIHPIKGIDVLLRAWRQVQHSFPDWQVDIRGPDEGGYQRQMEKLADSLAVERVTFSGPVYGPEKRAAYRQASLFVLPSHTENFGMAVAEALAHGVPAIVTKGAPWSGLGSHDCGWWIEHGEEPLRECLMSALNLSRTQLRERGERGRQWMSSDFSWQRVAAMMLQTYDWLVGGGQPPPWVVLE